jgi:hypothetical protein
MKEEKQTELGLIVVDLDDMNGELGTWLVDDRIDDREITLLKAYHMASCRRADRLDEINGVQVAAVHDMGRSSRRMIYGDDTAGERRAAFNTGRFEKAA